MEIMPGNKIPLNYFVHPIVQSYYDVKSTKKAESIINKLYTIYSSELNYYFLFPDEKITGVAMDILRNLQFYNQLVEMAKTNNHPNITIMEQEFEKLYRNYLKL